MSFGDIIGNDKVKKLLIHSINTNNILHSYRFVGEDGIGKALFATEFAKMILCNSTDAHVKPCLHCNSCIAFLGENHPDFMAIFPEDGKSIKIEQIRYFQEKIVEKPITSTKKVYVIYNSDCMTKEAQNCLLKTLEEPPQYAVIILVLSNESKLLPTIKSRCVKINFLSLTSDEITQYFLLHNLTLTPTILKLCNGSIGKALDLQNETIDYEDIDCLLEYLEQKDIIDVWHHATILYQAKDTIHNLFDYMNILFMDKLTVTHKINYINCIKFVEETKKRLTANANYDMCIDNLLLNIWEEFHEKYNRS